MMKRGAEINGGEKEQATWGKITVQLEEINQKILARRRKIKEISTKGQTVHRPNRTFQNNERKFHQQFGGSDTKNIPTTGCKRNRAILG